MALHMQGDLGLNIREAHAFNTNDGFSLDVFVVDQWQPQVRHGSRAYRAPQLQVCTVAAEEQGHWAGAGTDSWRCVLATSVPAATGAKLGGAAGATAAPDATPAAQGGSSAAAAASSGAVTVAATPGGATPELPHGM